MIGSGQVELGGTKGEGRDVRKRGVELLISLSRCSVREKATVEGEMKESCEQR